jgi:hypothetical protein
MVSHHPLKTHLAQAGLPYACEGNRQGRHQSPPQHRAEITESHDYDVVARILE